jgi:hypothetical protein
MLQFEDEIPDLLHDSRAEMQFLLLSGVHQLMVPVLEMSALLVPQFLSHQLDEVGVDADIPVLRDDQLYQLLQKTIRPQHSDVLFKQRCELFLLEVEAELLVFQIGSDEEQDGDELSHRYFTDSIVSFEGEKLPLAVCLEQYFWIVALLDDLGHLIVRQHTVDAVVPDPEQTVLS